MPKGLFFRSDIQGLRAIAVLGVMLFHYDRQLLPGGFIGVDIFFVISGFLITSILLKQKENLDFSLVCALRRFYIGRIKRIAPTYYVLLLVVTIVSMIIFIPKDYQFFNDSLKDSLWFTSNQYFADFGDYFAPKLDEIPLLHTWSLAIEMQFYLFYPFLIFLVKKEWLKKIVSALIVLLFGISTYQLSEGQAQGVYYGLYARIPEFLVGGSVVLFAEQLKNIQSKWYAVIGMALVFASFIFINEKTPFPGLYVIPSILGAALILVNFSGRGLSKWLSCSVLVWIGAISYSLYLWHWPILAFIRYVSGSYQLTLGQSIAYWGGAFMLASASYYWIEQWFRNKKLRHVSAKLSWLVVIVSVSLVTILSSRVNKTIVPLLPVELTRYADPATICHGKIVGDCIRGDRDSTEKPILVLGDSHAAMLNNFFDVVGRELKLSFRVITASSCVTIPSFDHQNLPKWAHKPCLEQIEQAKKYIKETDKILVTSQWWWHLESDDFVLALRNFATQYSNKLFVVMADVPNFMSFSSGKSYRFTYIGINFQHVSLDDRGILSNKRLRALASSITNLGYVDLTKEGLFETLPYYNDKLLYFDSHHLNESGAIEYGKFVLGKMKEISFFQIKGEK